LTIGAWASPLVLQHIMGNEAAQFDGRKFGYLGIPSPTIRLHVQSAERITR